MGFWWKGCSGRAGFQGWVILCLMTGLESGLKGKENKVLTG